MKIQCYGRADSTGLSRIFRAEGIESTPTGSGQAPDTERKEMGRTISKYLWDATLD